MYFPNRLTNLSFFSNVMTITMVENSQSYFSVSFLFTFITANTDEIICALSNVP